jgi:hypothetical protein
MTAAEDKAKAEAEAAKNLEKQAKAGESEAEKGKERARVQKTAEEQGETAPDKPEDYEPTPEEQEAVAQRKDHDEAYVKRVQAVRADNDEIAQARGELDVRQGLVPPGEDPEEAEAIAKERGAWEKKQEAEREKERKAAEKERGDRDPTVSEMAAQAKR